MLQTQGLLGKPADKRGCPLSEETKKCVHSIYTDQELTRELPGERNTVSICETYHQKHLILMNLKELHCQYLSQYLENPVSLSKFISLRPKYCVTVDAKDTLQACVCAIHQNVKLMCEVTPGQTDYKDILGKVVCDVEDPFCMIHRCDKCPGPANLITHLETLFTREGFEMEAKNKIHSMATDR